MKCNCTDVIILPNITMYGGDTTPWEITLVRENGANFSIAEGAECSATLTVVPFESASMVSNAAGVTPALTKRGISAATSAGGTAVTFNFAENDTKELQGKFLYQVEVRYASDLRIGQGNLFIKQNINQGETT